jgi:hypothetical protein
MQSAVGLPSSVMLEPTSAEATTQFWVHNSRRSKRHQAQSALVAASSALRRASGVHAISTGGTGKTNGQSDRAKQWNGESKATDAAHWRSLAQLAQGARVYRAPSATPKP